MSTHSPVRFERTSTAEALRRRSTVDLVADELRRRIMEGELPEGAHILQEHLAKDLGVSRIPVREALRKLEAEGLVVISSHRGGVVSKLSLSEITELFEMRAVLETWLLGLALPLMTDADLDKAEAAANEMLVGEVANWGELNRKFHESLYAPAKREQTVNMLRRIHRNIDRYLRLQITLTSGWQKAQEEHRNIVGLCRARDTRRAVAALDAHIMDAAGELTDMISKLREARNAETAT